MDKTTLPAMYWQLMKAPSIVTGGWCAVCGRRPANNQHHMVRRNAGELYRDGRRLGKPTVTLCGSGTCGCHGLAHQNRLHFRWVEPCARPLGRGKQPALGGGHLEYILLDGPTDYLTALSMDGWKRLPRWP